MKILGEGEDERASKHQCSRQMHSMQFQWGAGDEQHSRGQPCQFRLAGRRDEDIDTVQLLSPTRTNSLHKEMSSSRQERRQSPEASTELMAKGTGHRTDIETQLNLIIPFQAHYMTMDYSQFAREPYCLQNPQLVCLLPIHLASPTG